jgi:hypothetical protein
LVLHWLGFAKTPRPARCGAPAKASYLWTVWLRAVAQRRFSRALNRSRFRGQTKAR